MALAAPLAPLLRAARLIYTHDGMEGYRRSRAGRGFRFQLPSGEVLQDRGERRRLLALAIPPAYTEVWICLRADGHLQATGFDQRGRKQYRYHPAWMELTADRKFGELATFARALPRIRQIVRLQLARRGLDRDRIVAGIIALLDRTGYRVGNERYARENHSFGLVSLLSRHLYQEDGRWMVRFKGKAGKLHQAAIDDPRLTALIGELQELPGQHLFRYEDHQGAWHDAGTTEVNAWLKEAGGGDFSAKQFRTWRATVAFARELGRAPVEETATGRKRAEMAAIRTTAALLHHTPATCRKYYLHPAIFRAYRSGELHRAMQAPPPRMRRSDGSAKLLADERRVLALLERSVRRTR